MNRVVPTLALLIAAACSPFLQAEEADAGITVRIIGSGGPGNNPTRGEASVLIQHLSDTLLVDMGNGTQATLSSVGVKAAGIGALVLTHHHTDHDQEFPPILLETVRGGKGPLVIGPSGTKELTEFTMAFYAEDIAYRLSRQPGSRAAAAPQIREVHGNESFEALGFRIRTAAVNHTIETIAYRFESAGKSVVVSGDLSYSASLVELAKDANLLILDGGAVQSLGGSRGAMKPRSSETGGAATDTARSHSTTEELLRIIKESGAKKVVLTHLGAAPVNEAAIREFFSTAEGSSIVLAADRMEFSL